MSRLKKYMGFKLFMALCAVMQIIIILPHHHHDGSAVACYNPTHCVSVEEFEHEHDRDVDECSFNHVDFVMPARDQSDLSMEAIAYDLINNELLFDDILISSIGLQRFSNDSHTRFLANEGVIPLHTQYIPKALPPRAPTV